MMELRPYQQQAIRQTALALKEHREVVLTAPTSAGKSILIAGITKSFIDKNKESRVLILCHTSEILMQNQDKLMQMGVTNNSMYCAMLGQKDLSGQVVLASRDSMGREFELPQFDLCLLDEAHLLSEKKDSMYQRILKQINYKYCVGLTGTPWRMDNGVIFGPKRFFKACSYAIPMKMLIKQGYLSDYVFPDYGMERLIKTDGVRIVNKDFDKIEMESRASKSVKKCIDYWETHQENRRCSIMFCQSIAHAELIEKELTDRNYSTALITGTTHKKVRKETIEAARNGEYKTLLTVGCLTTGVDIPIIDCAVVMRATQSASLFVQMMGRALRKYPGKDNALIIDFTDNFDRFESIEDPLAPKGFSKKEKNNELDEWQLGDIQIESKMLKNCPKCKTPLGISTRVCPNCGHLFLQNTVEVHTGKQKKETWLELLIKPTITYSETKSKIPCAIITYKTKIGTFKEWVYPESKKPWQRIEAHKKLAAIKTAKYILVDKSKNELFPKIKVKQ